MSRPDPLLIVNPVAGGGRARRCAESVAQALGGAAQQFTRSLAHAHDLAVAARERGQIAVAVGGDGLVTEIANVYAHSGLSMAVVPAGRGNDLARSVGIGSVTQAIAAIEAGRPRVIDLGRVNGRYFTSIASVGIDSSVLEIANRVRHVHGRAVYAYSTLLALARWHSERYTVELDGVVTELEGYSVAVANAPNYGGGMRLAPDADMTDGFFDVLTIAAISKPHFLWHAPKVFWGKHITVPAITIRRARTVRISGGSRWALYADGERLTTLPATVICEARALELLVPGSQVSH